MTSGLVGASPESATLARPVCGYFYLWPKDLPATTPRYPYLTEMDSMAAVHVVSFKDWWEKLPQGFPQERETVGKTWSTSQRQAP